MCKAYDYGVANTEPVPGESLVLFSKERAIGRLITHMAAKVSMGVDLGLGNQCMLSGYLSLVFRMSVLPSLPWSLGCSLLRLSIYCNLPF